MLNLKIDSNFENINVKIKEINGFCVNVNLISLHSVSTVRLVPFSC